MYLGYKTAKLELGSRTNFTVKLEPDRKVIDEVVVVAYGTQKKVSVTGSVASVGNTDLKRAPVSNFSTALSGRLPGLTVTQTSGQPGAEKVNMKLRGVSTTGDSSPLILIDGVAKYYREAAFIACKDTPIVLASLGNDAGIYGAAKMLID